MMWSLAGCAILIVSTVAPMEYAPQLLIAVILCGIAAELKKIANKMN